MTLLKKRTNETYPDWIRRHKITEPVHHNHVNTKCPFNVIPWEELWTVTDGFKYDVRKIEEIYSALGITSGNGEWLISAYKYDKTIGKKIIAKWEHFVTEVLESIDFSDDEFIDDTN